MSDCFCTANYQCLACERAERKFNRVAKQVERKRPTPAIVAQCGTRSGYKRHRANGEEACAECKSAQNKSVRAWQLAHPLRHNISKDKRNAKRREMRARANG